MKKNVLVIGGSGFIGSHVADKLSENGNNVTIFDLKKSIYIKNKQKFIKGDLLKINELKKSLNGIDIVYHFGGVVDIEYSKKNSNECLLNNIIGTNNLLNIISNMSKKPKIFFGSTVYIYSKYGSIYRISKETCEKLIYEYASSHKINYVIFRFGTVYGPRSDENNSIYRYIRNIVNNNSKNLRLNVSGNELREFIHVKDVAKVCSDFVLSPIKNLNKSYIITGLDKLKVSDLINLILEIANQKLNIIYKKTNSDHYKITPYNYKEEISEKIFPKTHIDLGLGILDMIKDLNNFKHKK